MDQRNIGGHRMLAGALLILLAAPFVLAEAQADRVPPKPSVDDFDCARSECGCWRKTVLEYATTVVDFGGHPVEGIEVRCRGEEDPVAVTDPAGRAAFSVATRVSPGCGFERCQSLRFEDPEGKFHALATTVQATQGRRAVLEKLRSDECRAGARSPLGTDLADLGKVLAALERAFNDQDAVALSGLFVPDGVLHDWRGRAATTQAGIRRNYEQGFREIRRTRRERLEDGREVVLQSYPLEAPNVTLRWDRVSAWGTNEASIEGTWCARGALGPTGAVLPDVHRASRGAAGYLRVNLRREGGEWAIVHLAAEAPPKGGGDSSELPPGGDLPTAGTKYFVLSERVIVDEQPAHGLFIAGRVEDGRFTPEGEIEGSGEFAGERGGTPGWVELASGTFHMMATAKAREAPAVDGEMGQDGLFRPYAREAVPGAAIRYVVSGGLTGRGGDRLSISADGTARLESSTPPIEEVLDPEEHASLLALFADFAPSGAGAGCPDGFVRTVTYGEISASMSDCGPSGGTINPRLKRIVSALSDLAARLRHEHAPSEIAGFALRWEEGGWYLDFAAGGESRRVGVPSDFLVPDPGDGSSGSGYVSSENFDESVTSFPIGDGRTGLHASSYSVSGEGSAQAAAGRDVFLTLDPRSLKLRPGGLELGITKQRHRRAGCWEAVFHTFLVGDVDRNGLKDIGVIAERMSCEEREQQDLDVVVGPFHTREPVRWHLYGNGKWTYDPAFDHRLPAARRELPRIGLVKSPIEYVRELLKDGSAL